jgi:hypothetical protein
MRLPVTSWSLSRVLLFFISLASLSGLLAGTARADFSDAWQEGYGNMPYELPDDRELYPGYTQYANLRPESSINDGRVGDAFQPSGTGSPPYGNHQYFTVGGGNIDDAGGNQSGNDYRLATFVVYTTNPGNKRLQFSFVNRAVNLESGNNCKARLRISIISQVPGNPVRAGTLNYNGPDDQCGGQDYYGDAPGVDDSRGVKATDFARIRVADANGVEYDTPIYKAYVSVRLIDGDGDQSSFRVRVLDGARMGLAADSWMNIYASKLGDRHHLQLKWRNKCGTPHSTDNVFAYSDGDEGKPSIQPTSDGGNITASRADGYTANRDLGESGQIGIPRASSSSGVEYSQKVDLNYIHGGNGISINLPDETGNYYFTTCPPSPIDPKIGYACVSPRNGSAQIWARGYPSDWPPDTWRYQLHAYDADGNLIASSPRGVYTWSSGSGVQTGNRLLGANGDTNQGDRWTWDGGGRFRTGERVDFRIEYFRLNNRMVEVPVSVTGFMPVSGRPCPTPVNWWLQPYSGVNQDGTNNSVGYVELDRAVRFEHVLGNSGPDAASGFGGGVESNFDPVFPETGTGNYANIGYLPSQPFAPGNALVYSQSMRAGSGTEWLGRNYCQRFHIENRNMVNDSLSNGTADSGPVCATVVGGKTAIGGTVQAEAEPEEQVTFRIDLGTNHYTGGGGWGGYAAGCTYTSAIVGSGSCTRSVGGNGTQTVSIPYTIPGNMAIGTDVCVTATLTITNGAFYADPTRRTVEMCTKVVARPYFKVFGGDVSAGNGFGGASCIHNSSVIGWNKGGSEYYGAGVQYAIYAHGVIEGVAPGRGLPNTADFGGGDPRKLAFANTAGSAAGRGPYGGGLRTGGCSSDYWGGKPQNTDITDWRDIGDSNRDIYGFDRIFEASGAVVLRGQSENSANFFARNNNTKLYVDGDVYINSDITAENGAESIDQIPNFMLIARGNIYIGANVRNLFGTYVAQPTDGGGKGQIYTCAKSSFEPVENRDLYNDCRTQLKVTGSFVASNIHLQRTLGSLYRDKGGNALGGSGYDNAGEIFQYNPLTWLRQSTSSSTSMGQDTYDAMTILPPVL